MRSVTANSNIARWGTLAFAAIDFRFIVEDNTLRNPLPNAFARPSPLRATLWSFCRLTVTLCETRTSRHLAAVFCGQFAEASAHSWAFSPITIGEKPQVATVEKHRG